MTEYESSKNGYAPHADQTKITCPKCGYGIFRTFPQGAPADGLWAWEHVCDRCGHYIALELIR